MRSANIANASVEIARNELRRRNRVARSAVKHFRKCVSIMRRNARNNGYALTVHGSLLRDVDLVAVPWTTTATSARHMKDDLVKLITALYRGEGVYASRKATRKPHGRVAYVIHVPDGTYFDLSVMPRRA